MKKTLVLLKPDAIQRRLIGRIIQRFEDKGLKIVALRMMSISRRKAEELYSPHIDKDFYEPLMKFVTAGPLVAIVLAGPDAIAVIRSMAGATFGPDASPGTIRGDFGASRRYNLVHASDSPENAAREIAIFFDESELEDYSLLIEDWEYCTLDMEWTGE